MSARSYVRPVADLPSESVSTSADPFADRLVALLDSVDDLSSSSDAIAALCTDWLTHYHLSSTRANVLRALPLPSDAVVLELGAGGGAVTRFLAESFASVEAWEPDEGLAMVASRRCADLDAAQVHAGWIDDIPTGRAYDLVVALDVLGEIERHGGDLEQLVAWCRSRLTPDGVLVIGADNADGVRFLAGSATPRRRDDDSHRPPRIARDRLDETVRSQGLVTTVLSAFPDHRDAQVLFDHESLASLAPQLLEALPHFPSPSYDGSAPGSQEGMLWSTALAAGAGRHSSNGLVVVASAGGARPAAVATYWSQGRRAALSATNSVVVEHDEVVVRRARTFPAAPEDDCPLSLRPHTEPMLRGTTMPSELARVDDLAAAAALLRAWTTLVDSSVHDGAAVPWDLIPRNVMVLESGELAPFDQEWELGATAADVDAVVTRGAFWLAYDLLFDHGRPAWLCGETVGQAADFILRLVRPAAPARWIESFAENEADLMSYIWPVPAGRSRSSTYRRERKNVTALSNTPSPGHGDPAAPAASADADLRSVVESLSAANADLRAENEALKIELRHAALAHRDDNMGLVAASEALKDRLERAHARNRRQKARLVAAQGQLKAIKTSRTWKIGTAIVRPLTAIRRSFRR
jgi:SAM-dependent methyltransferase